MLTMPLPSVGARKAGKNEHAASSATLAPQKIYRCGNIYQSMPCVAQASAFEGGLVFHDRQTPHQRQAAQQAKKQLNKQAEIIEKAQKKATLAAQRDAGKAAGLSCHVSGARPFDTCKTQSSKEKSVSHHNKKQKKRPEDGPYLSNNVE